MVSLLGYVLLGLVAGTASGLFGIGGGIIIIPALVYFFHLGQHQAQGTTLALMVLPIGLLAALKYYSQGWVNLKIALLICLGFFFGGLVGASIAGTIPDLPLKRMFGVLLLGVAVKMIAGK